MELRLVTTVLVGILLAGCKGDTGGQAKPDAAKPSGKQPADFPEPKQLCTDTLSTLTAKLHPNGVSPEIMDQIKGMRTRCRAALDGQPDAVFVSNAECMIGAKDFAGFDECTSTPSR